VENSGRCVLWCCDPMHGNTRFMMFDSHDNEVVGCVDHLDLAKRPYVKVRLLDDIKRELKSFFDIVKGCGAYPAGIHLESTAEDVFECVDVVDRNIMSTTYCDPRLNRIQMFDLMKMVKEEL